MQYIDSIEQMKARAQSPRGRKLVQYMKESVAGWMKGFQDDPSVESGWGHVYFCSECGSFLKLDPSDAHHHRCPNCGKVMTGEQYDAAWIYLYRYDAIMSALQAAVLYRLEEKAEYLEYFQKVVGFYGENWYRFCEHGRNTWPSGNGKITPQALNEAIFLVRIAAGMELLKEALPPEFIQRIQNWMLIPCAYFLDAQKRWIHNIPCWLNAAVGTVGLMTGNEDLTDRAFTRQYGFIDQVRNGGVTQSYFWYEGSIHYNFFTLEAFMNTMLFAEIYNQPVPEDVQETVYEMLLAPCKYAFSNGQLPNPNDGWPNLGLKTYSFIYEMGAKIYSHKAGGGHLAALAQAINEMDYERVPVPLSYPTYAGDVSLEWLLFSQPSQPEEIPYFKASYVFEASNFATLKKKHVELFHKFGHCTKSHAHPDKMTVEVQAFGERITHDLSNCGYAARLCPEFHRTSVSHNTVVMDGRNHPTTNPGQVIKYEGSVLETKAEEAYENVDFSRRLELEDTRWKDRFEVVNKNAQAHTWDYVLHLDGTIESELETVPGSLGYTENGYAYLEEARRAAPQEELTIRWRFANGVYGSQTLSLKDKELWICKSPDNPPKADVRRTTLIVRSRERQPVFEQNWEFWRER